MSDEEAVRALVAIRFTLAMLTSTHGEPCEGNECKAMEEGRDAIRQLDLVLLKLTVKPEPEAKALVYNSTT